MTKPLCLSTNDLTPAQLIELRCRAFVSGDFEAVFDSYHPESSFRAHFRSRQEYLDYGQQMLGDFTILSWSILRVEEPSGRETRVLYRLKSLCQGQPQDTLELAGLVQTEQGWRYLWGEKLPREVFNGPVDQVPFSLFEQTEGVMRF